MTEHFKIYKDRELLTAGNVNDPSVASVVSVPHTDLSNNDQQEPASESEPDSDSDSLISDGTFGTHHIQRYRGQNVIRWL